MTNRLQKLQARRFDPSFQTKMVFAEAYSSFRSNSDSLRYAIGTMQKINPEYTENTFRQGHRVRDQLASRLSKVEFQFQGSVTNDTHIKAYSDIDLLVICTKFYWVEYADDSAVTYQGNPTEDLTEIRSGSVRTIREKFPQVEVDDSKARAVSLSGGSLTRRVDVVPAGWFNTSDYRSSGRLEDRGVKVLDRKTGAFLVNMPFRHNARVDRMDLQSNGGLRKVARLLKSLAYDSDRPERLTSYDIVALAYSIPPAPITVAPAYDHRILLVCRIFLSSLLDNAAQRESLLVPDGSRKVFCDSHATVAGLQSLLNDLELLISDIEAETRVSLVNLVAQPLDLYSS